MVCNVGALGGLLYGEGVGVLGFVKGGEEGEELITGDECGGGDDDRMAC